MVLVEVEEDDDVVRGELDAIRFVEPFELELVLELELELELVVFKGALDPELL